MRRSELVGEKGDETMDGDSLLLHVGFHGCRKTLIIPKYNNLWCDLTDR